MTDPLFILLSGVVTVIVLIVVLRINAFLSLLAAAFVVRFMTPMQAGQVWDNNIMDVCTAFGTMAGKVGILIAMGAIIGKCMLDSGAANRIIRFILAIFGQRLVPVALLSSGFLLSIPIFYDTTFYLLVPIARSVYGVIRKNYILYMMTIGLGATLSHTLIPPTPGPVTVAEALRIPLGSMMIVSLLVGCCVAPCALAVAMLMNWFVPNPEIHFDDQVGEEEPSGSEEQVFAEPSLFLSFLPILVPVVLVALRTTVELLEKSGLFVVTKNGLLLYNLCRLGGNPQFALILAAMIGMGTLWYVRRFTLNQLGRRIESALISAGMILLITSAGGAFGEMLRKAEVGERIRDLSVLGDDLHGPGLLLLAFGIAALIKSAQGSSTTAMITTAGIFSGMYVSESLSFHPAYLAVTIGLGSCVTGWMNDSGFWLFCRMGGIRETDALRTWTLGLALLGVCGLIVVLLLSRLVPLTMLPGGSL